MTFLKVSGIVSKGEAGVVLDRVGFTQRKFENIAVVGETGSGKSTLLKIIAGLVEPESGTVHFENAPVQGPANNLVPGHEGISYLSQDFELPRNLTVEQILRYANNLSIDGAGFLYDSCEISHLLKRKPDQLSGGERQRIALARLLVTSPRLLLLDEAFSNLDRAHKITMKKILGEVGRRMKISFILISHDPEDILSWAHKILVLRGGKIVQQGSPEKVYRQPVNEYAAGLLGTFNLLVPGKNTPLKNLSAAKTKKKELVRGEQFELGAMRKRAVPGRVTDIKYFGSYYEVEVNCAGTTLAVKTQRCRFKKGNLVYVSRIRA